MKLALDPGESQTAAALVADRFIRFVEEFDPAHFLVLRFAADPIGVSEASGFDVSAVVDERSLAGEGRINQSNCRGWLLTHYLNELDGLDNLSANLTYRDLESAGLIDPDIDIDVDVIQGLRQGRDVRPWATELGRALLDWIAEP